MPEIHEENNNAQIRSSLSQLILKSGSNNTLDSIFSHCHQESNPSPVVQPLGSSVYLRQRDLLQKFCEENRTNPAGDPFKNFLLGFGESANKLNAVKNAVDAKIQAIRQKVRREKAKTEAKKSDESVMAVESSSCSLAGNESWSSTISPSVSEDGFWMSDTSPVSGELAAGAVAEQTSEMEDCFLARMPSFDPELIWEVLAN
nr:ethylene-responsive transcription factor ERF061-like [Ipomoea trifida]